MAAVQYTKAYWKAEADIQKLATGKFQGVVLISNTAKSRDQAMHNVEVPSETPQEALEEAKALAHRLLADL